MRGSVSSSGSISNRGSLASITSNSDFRSNSNYSSTSLDIHRSNSSTNISAFGSSISN